MHLYISRLSDHIYFGKYPCSETFNELAKVGVTMIVDMTCEAEKLTKYTMPSHMIRIIVPTPDCSTPSDERVEGAVNYFCECLKLGHVIYIHCKGGHGRSPTLAGILFGRYYGIGYNEVLEQIRKAHRARIVMKPNLRAKGAPQTKEQKDQIQRFLS